MKDWPYLLSKSLDQYMNSYRAMQKILIHGGSMPPQMYGEVLQKKKAKKKGKNK